MCPHDSPVYTYPFWQLKMFDRGAQVKISEILTEIQAKGKKKKEKDLLFNPLIHKF